MIAVAPGGSAFGGEDQGKRAFVARKGGLGLGELTHDDHFLESDFRGAFLLAQDSACPL
jgi:hypothetical protein